MTNMNTIEALTIIVSMFLSQALQDWNCNRLSNFMPPFLAGKLDFGGGLTFRYEVCGRKDMYPKYIEFQSRMESGALGYGCIILRDAGSQRIRFDGFERADEHDRARLRDAADWAVAVFGEYNLRKQHREVETRLHRTEPVKHSQEWLYREPSTREMSLGSDADAPFVDYVGNQCVDPEPEKERHYVVPSWHSAGYVTRKGTYVEPCVKHRRCSLVTCSGA